VKILRCTLVLLLAASAPLFAAIDRPVRVTGGRVEGVAGRSPSVRAFKGIPFAAAPVGDRRWQAPGPVVPWTGVKRATTFGASCAQRLVADNRPWTYEFMTHNEVSEDCLYLNVWTPAGSARERRPVFVYVYGGAFTEGSAAVPLYDGEGLASKGIVVVTFNYRLGALGFLAHPGLTATAASHASGNYGLLDQIAALAWVRDNIAAFGGDPHRVTIAGQSAGGMSVHALIVSPLAKGLFHRAIVQSGGSSVGGGGISTSYRLLADAEADGQRFATAKSASTIAELRKLSWQQILEPLPTPAGGAPQVPLRFSPIVDGYVVPEPVRDVYAKGHQNDVPTLTGVNLGELGGLQPAQAPLTAAAFVTRARQRFGPMADAFLALYPANTDAEAADALARSSRDQALASLFLWARERAKTANTPAFLYLWDHTLPGPDASRYGAFHSSELPYVLNTLGASDRPFVDADHRIAELMSSYWVNFATAGTPNGPRVPNWSAAGARPEVMEVGDTTGPTPVAGNPAIFAFFERLLLTAR
jgi:para-nitrobenzyl esterase